MTEVLLNVYDLAPQASNASGASSAAAGGFSSFSPSSVPSMSSVSSAGNASAAAADTAADNSAAASDGGLSGLLRAVGGLSHALGLGAYHTGIEVYGVEYGFGGHDVPGMTGIYDCTPRTAPSGIFREQISLGPTALTRSAVAKLVADLQSSADFYGECYDVLRWNCNHFSHAFAERLGSQTPPPHVNRLASIGAFGASIASWFSASATPQQSAEARESHPAQSFHAFSGTGHTLSGTASSLPVASQESDATSPNDSDVARRRALMAEAAQRRFQTHA